MGALKIDERKTCPACGEEMLSKVEFRTDRKVVFCQRCEPKAVYIEVERW